MKKIVIIGGGLAGLFTSIQLARKGIECQVIEKKTYPFHRVCGEYISNETVPFLKSLDLYPTKFNPPVITRFMLSSVRGENNTLPLDMGGFGISRYAFDHFLFEEAVKQGVQFSQNTEVENVSFHDDRFAITAGGKTLFADVVVGAFGKRSRMDVQLNRTFIQKRSPYVGVKYHVQTDHPADLIALHNFPGGYCGMSNVEEGKTNLCYLTHRDNLKKFGNIGEMEEEVLFRNPVLKNVFKNSQFLFDKPETINEISFETKTPVEQHVLMAGDAAGMITPLCGNGMAMAMHTSKILTELVTRFCQDRSFTRDNLEREYTRLWDKNFAARLWMGRQVQKLFGSAWASAIAVGLAIHVKPVARQIIKRTHGDIF